MTLPKEAQWLEEAHRAMPTLHEEIARPENLISVHSDASAFQGWRASNEAHAAALSERELHQGSSFILDFGKHLVGYLQLELRPLATVGDAPVRLRLIFGEVLAEVAEPFSDYRGKLSASWLQEEVVTIDWLPVQYELPRRYAFRYVKVEVVAAPSAAVCVTSCRCRYVSSAMRAATPPSFGDAEINRITEVSLRTLRNCMQTVVEDGPKRDRRLWLGDLRLQALANYHSYRNFELVKRCLYLFAALPNPDGLVSACVYEYPVPRCGNIRLLTYAAFFAPTLLEYAEHSGDWETARDLLPVARRQVDFLRACVGSDGIFVDPGTYWLFVDWATLDKQASMQAIIILSLNSTLQLAKKTGCSDQADGLKDLMELMTRAAREKLINESGLVVSGRHAELSYASAAWMILAGVLNEHEAAAALHGLENRSDVVKPASPYMYHYVAEAMFCCGLHRQALELIRSYWGGMLRLGATTFWEVYVPGEQKRSPYGDHRINSYCHAWSCTPAYLLHRYAASTA